MILSTSRWGLWQKEQAKPDGFEYLGIVFLRCCTPYKVAGEVWTRQDLNANLGGAWQGEGEISMEFRGGLCWV